MASLQARLKSLASGRNFASPLENNNVSILDVYSAHHDELDEGQASHAEHHSLRSTSARAEQVYHMTFRQRLRYRIQERLAAVVSAPSQWVFLVLLGILAAISGYLMDAVAGAMHSARLELTANQPAMVAFLLWLAWSLLFTAIAASVGLLISPHAEGSGIPEIKSIISGTPTLSHYLSFKVLVAKAIGVVSALGAGLSIGKEGPFVHVAAILAHKMWKLPCFHRSGHLRGTLRTQNLAAAVAAGVTAVFGAPVGGVLFSIEVASTYYMVSNLWKAFVVSIFCVVTFEVINTLKEDDLFSDTVFVAAQDVSWQFLAYGVLGILCGLVAALVVFVSAKAQLLQRILVSSTATRFAYALSIAAACAVFTSPAAFLRYSDREVINQLFAYTDSKESSLPATWGHPSVIITLAAYTVHAHELPPAQPRTLTPLGGETMQQIVKFILTPLSISLPIPCGLFTPIFVMGAAFGRLYGQILYAWFPDAGIVPGAYAVVGAAAMTSGATQTLSTTVIVFELTGQLHHMVPLLFATLLSYSVCGTFSVSIYDVLLALKGIPYLPRVHTAKLRLMTAKDLMHTELRYLTLKGTYRDALRLLALPPLGGEGGQKMYEIPIVQSEAMPRLVGSIQRLALEDVFAQQRDIAARKAAMKQQRSNDDTLVLSPLTEPASPADDAAASGDAVVSVAAGSNASLQHLLDDTNAHSPLSPASQGNGGFPGAGAGAGAEDGGAADSAASTATDVAVPLRSSGDVVEASADGSTYRAPVAAGDTAAAVPQPGGSSTQPYRESWLQQRIHFGATSTARLHIDPAPFQLTELTPLTKVHFLFATCQFAQAFITRHDGRLAGILLKEDFSAEGRLVDARLRRRSSANQL